MIGHPPKHLDTINHDRQVNCTLCRVTQFHGREAEGCERRNHPRFCIVWYFWTNTLKFWTINTWLMNSSNMTWTPWNIFLLILPVYNIHCTWTVRAYPTYCAWTSTALSIQSTAILTLQWTFLHTKKKRKIVMSKVKGVHSSWVRLRFSEIQTCAKTSIFHFWHVYMWALFYFFIASLNTNLWGFLLVNRTFCFKSQEWRHVISVDGGIPALPQIKLTISYI